MKKKNIRKEEKGGGGLGVGRGQLVLNIFFSIYNKKCACVSVEKKTSSPVNATGEADTRGLADSHFNSHK